MAKMFILFVFCKTATIFYKVLIESAKIMAGNHLKPI